MSERILFALSSLLFVFVTPPTIIRLINQDWAIFFLDLFLVSSAAFIFYNTLKGRYLTFLKFYMCCLVSLGASLTVIFGGVEQVYWIYPTVLTAFFLVKHRYAFLFTFAISVAIAPVLMDNLQGMHILTIYFALYGTTGFISAFSQEIISENKSLSSLATIDPLTGAGNRRLFAEEANAYIKSSKEDGLIYSMIVIDIDDFKIINDTKGHIVGDQILQHLCSTISKRLASSANLYRLGGEEFGIIVPGDNLTDGINFAELVKFVIANEHDSQLPPYTVSMGVAILKRNESLDDWLHRADIAMYTAKSNGKDRIFKAEELPKGDIVEDFSRHRSSRASKR